MLNVKVADNIGAQSGGGIRIDGNSTLDLVNSVVDKNSTSGGGGGIRASSGSLTITNSKILENSAIFGRYLF